MNKEITIVFVSYYSKLKISKYLKQFNNIFKVIIVENSNDLSLRKEFKKFKNISIIYNKKNLGFGASSNIGLKKIKTKYGLHLDLDTSFSNKSIFQLIDQANKLDDFIILGPKIKKYNYKSRDFRKKNYLKNLNLMNFIDGCCMLFNIKKLKVNGYFDEKFFLYFEEYDLFKRYLKKNEKIIMTNVASIYHAGRSSSDKKYNNEIEVNRNWHYMWSKFYFYKKHYNYFYAFIKISKSFFSSMIKVFFYTIFANNFKKDIYSARLKGIYSSICNKKSSYRPKI
jgi:GT2 family glycosyltransferase